MIRGEDEMEAVAKHEVQKGIGSMTFHTFMTKKEAYGSGRTFARVVFEPGISIGVREHQGELKRYYILKGQALVTDNDVESVLNPGGYHICKDGDSHNIACYEDEAMEIIAFIINVPAWGCQKGYFERDTGPGCLFWKDCLNLVPGGQFYIFA